MGDSIGPGRAIANRIERAVPLKPQGPVTMKLRDEDLDCAMIIPPARKETRCDNHLRHLRCSC